MPHRRPPPSIRLAFRNPNTSHLTPLREFHKRLPKSSDRIHRMTDVDLLLLHQKLEALRGLMPDEAAVVGALVDNLLAHYYAAHAHEEHQG